MTDSRQFSCPFCGGRLKLGTVRLASNIWRWLFVGYSWSRLDFLEAGEKPTRKSIILDQGGEQSASKCECCGTISIFNEPPLKGKFDPEDY